MCLVRLYSNFKMNGQVEIGWILNVIWVSYAYIRLMFHFVGDWRWGCGWENCLSFWSVFMLKDYLTTVSFPFIKFSARGRQSFSSKVGLTMIVKWINDAIMAIDTRQMLCCESVNGSYDNYSSHMGFSRDLVDFRVFIFYLLAVKRRKDSSWHVTTCLLSTEKY